MAQRIFIPGSEWLYFKIYTGTKTADQILIRGIYPYVRNLYANNKIDRYFFIRYTDPDFHIRFRIHIPEFSNYNDIFREFVQRFQPNIEDGSIKKIMCDTYVREIERYGTETIEYTEELFRIDSAAVMELLSGFTNIPSEDKETVRWKTALLLLDDTLSAFGYDLKEKLRMLRQMSDSYKQEFRFTSHNYTKQLNDKYRAQRSAIDQLFASERNALYADVLEYRKRQFIVIAQKIQQSLTTTVFPKQDDLLFSIEHMTMNRWFRSHNRLHELVVYDFLRKYYESKQAKLEYAQK